MRKFFMAMTLAALSNVAMAAWQVVETTPEVTIHVDPATVKKAGNRATLWILLDYKQPQPDKTGKKVLSDKVQYQFDCKEKQYQTIYTSAHTGQMAGGEIVNINPDPPKLTPVAAGTLDEVFWQRACGTGKAKP